MRGEINEKNSIIMHLTYFHLKGQETWKTKITAQSTSDLSPKQQMSEISLKTSDLILKHQKCQHCFWRFCQNLLTNVQ